MKIQQFGIGIVMKIGINLVTTIDQKVIGLK